jgi:hypothetical protein
MLLNYYILCLLFIKLLIVSRDASSFDIHRSILLLLLVVVVVVVVYEEMEFEFQQYAITN